MSTKMTSYASKIETMLNNAQKLKARKFLSLKGSKQIRLPSINKTKEDYWTRVSKGIKLAFSVKEDAKTPSYQKYLQRLMKYGRFDQSVYLMAALMMKDLMLHPKLEIDFEKCGLKLFATCMLLSHKYIMDITWKLDAAAKILGFPKAALAEMEVLLLTTFQFNLTMSEKDYKNIRVYLKSIESEVKKANNALILARRE